MRDTLSEIISDTVSSVPITDTSIYLQKRKRKTYDKDESRIRKDQAIADHLMSYNEDQVEDMTRNLQWRSQIPTAPCGPHVLPAS